MKLGFGWIWDELNDETAFMDLMFYLHRFTRSCFIPKIVTRKCGFPKHVHMSESGVQWIQEVKTNLDERQLDVH